MTAQASPPNTSTVATDCFDQSFEAIDQYFACMHLCDRDDPTCANDCLADHMNFSHG
jgi:hypothetical protein